jgi:hypothetical protein
LSPTRDDQLEKRLCLGEQRTQRAGSKGMGFVFDRAITNGFIIEHHLVPSDVSQAVKLVKFTKVNFALGYAQEVLSSVPTLRRRSPAGLCVLQAQATNTSGLLSPASKHLQKITEHELVDMGAVARLNQRTSPAGRKKAKAKTQKGGCAYAHCTITKPKRPQLRCGPCRGGEGAFYHLPCFFACHRVTKP